MITVRHFVLAAALLVFGAYATNPILAQQRDPIITNMPSSQELDELQIKLLYRPLGGIENRVPTDPYGTVRMRVGIGFGFKDKPDEYKVAQAYNNQDAFAVADTDGCSDVIGMQVWVKQGDRPEEQYPEPLICRAPEGECLIRARIDWLPANQLRKTTSVVRRALFLYLV